MKTLPLLGAAWVVCATSLSAWTLSEADLSSLAGKLAASKAAEAPSMELGLVMATSPEDRLSAAKAVFASALKAHPSAIASLLAPLLRAVPGSGEALAQIALDQSVDNAPTVIRQVAEFQPQLANVVLAMAIEKNPKKERQYRRVLASARAGFRRLSTNDPTQLSEQQIIAPFPLSPTPNPYGSLNP